MKRKARIVMGIDPGYGRLGFAVIDTAGAKPTSLTHGVITTEANGETGKRLAEIAADIRGLLVRFTPDLLVIEELFFAKSTTTALKVAEVRGVVMLLAAEAGVAVVQVKPNEVKMATTGYGRADKKQMQEMVKVLFGLKAIPKPDDAADALAIAFTGATRLIL